MAAKKYKRMTNREKDERKRIKKNLQEKGIIPPDKPRLNRKKFAKEVCDEWKDFQSFYDWSMSSGYDDALTIDRINNAAMYSPENCEWVTLQENIRRRDVCKTGSRI